MHCEPLKKTEGIFVIISSRRAGQVCRVSPHNNLSSPHHAMRLDHSPQWLCINTNHSKPRNFVTPWKEADGVGGWWFAWLTPWSSAPTFLAISTLRAARDQEVSKYCLQSGPWLVNGWLDLPWWSNCLSWYQYQSPPLHLYTTSTTSTLCTLPIPGELFNKMWMFKFDFVTALGQQRKCPMKRRMAHSCHNRWHLDWQFFGWKINETDCHFTSWKENSF